MEHSEERDQDLKRVETPQSDESAPHEEPPTRPVRMKWGRPVEEEIPEETSEARQDAIAHSESDVGSLPPREDPRILALRARMEREAAEQKKKAEAADPPAPTVPPPQAVTNSPQDTQKTRKRPGKGSGDMTSAPPRPPQGTQKTDAEELRRRTEEATRLKEAENAKLRAELEQARLRKKIRRKRRKEQFGDVVLFLLGAVLSLFRRIRISGKAILAIVLTLGIAVVLATVLGLILGKYVDTNATPESSVTEEETEESTESIGADRTVPRLNAGIVSLEDATERFLKSEALRFASTGMTSVSLLLRDAEGDLLYASQTDGVFGETAENTDLLSIDEILAPFVSRGLYVSCLLPIRYFSDGDPYSEEILYAYEKTLLQEIAEAGANEVVLLPGEGSLIGASETESPEAALEKLYDLCRAVHRRSASTAVGIALSPEFLATKESDRYLGEIAEEFDFLLIDLRFAARSEEDQYEAVSESISSHLYFILRYSMRVLIPEGCADAVTRAEIYDWQEGSVSLTAPSES